MTSERVEVESTTMPPSTIWAEHAGDQARATAASRSRRRGVAHQRAEHGGDHGDRHEAGDQPVAELDHGVAAAVAAPRLLWRRSASRCSPGPSRSAGRPRR